MKFGLRIVASIQHVGGGGGGGIFVPMLTLIISGFDSKSSTTLSKCKYDHGAAATTVFYNLRLGHPTLEQPYDLALLFQPMLILGISIGVTLNVLFVDWMIIIMLYGFLSLSSPTSSLQQLQSSLLSLSLAGEKQTTRRWKGEEEKNGETERVET
uniref:Uncharacterized protein n=1 Tax=Salix viminalis TaxID=40686 RepID=A0A6N2N574_SALVM